MDKEHTREIRKQFGINLTGERKARRWSRARMAEKFDLSPGAIQKYEEGRSFPKVAKLIEMADYFNLDIDVFLGRIRPEKGEIPGRSVFTLRSKEEG